MIQTTGKTLMSIPFGIGARHLNTPASPIFKSTCSRALLCTRPLIGVWGSRIFEELVQGDTSELLPPPLNGLPSVPALTDASQHTLLTSLCLPMIPWPARGHCSRTMSVIWAPLWLPIPAAAGWTHGSSCGEVFLQQFVFWGSKSWCLYRIGSKWHCENFPPPPHPSPLFFYFRCLSLGSCFFGKLATVSPFNYVHFCCLLLHAVSGPLCVPDLLCNMARKYLSMTFVWCHQLTVLDACFIVRRCDICV